MNKQYSSLKIFHHQEVLDALRGEQRKAPLYIRLKPTNFCNHHCSYCTYGSGQTENKTMNRDLVQSQMMIPWDKMREIISDIGLIGVKAVTLSGGGEPLTYPKIVELVKMIESYGIDLSLISNGQLLQGKIAELFYQAKWVRISFDSPNAQEYADLRRVSTKAFEQVCNNIQSFAANKLDTCALGVNYVIGKANYKRVYEAAMFLKSLGVENIKFSAMVDNSSGYHKEIKQSVMEQIQQAQKELISEKFSIVSNYGMDAEKQMFSGQPFTTCYIAKLLTVIAADCNVYLCHTRAYDSKAVLGNLQKQTFQELWFSKKTTKKLDALNPQCDCNNFCAYCERNQLIQEYFNIDYNHINFI